MTISHSWIFLLALTVCCGFAAQLSTKPENGNGFQVVMFETATVTPSSTPIIPTAAVCEIVLHEDIAPGPTIFWIYLICSFGLVLLGGLMSGLTVGFMSIDRLKLEVLKEAGTEGEKVMVELVAPVLENHHLLLVTLLLTNAAAMEALPVLLDRIMPSYLAIILSVTFVLMFGEVIPQAICTANPLLICAQTAWIVRILEVICYPIAAPVARLLDHILGDHSAHILFKRSELTTLINMHGAQEGEEKGPLKAEEATVIRGALEFTHKTAADVMTKMEFVCMLDIDRKLDMDTLAQILGMGHSRIPVFSSSRHNVKGLLLVKRLIVANPENRRPVQHFVHRRPMVVPPTLALYELLNHFQTGRSHMAIVTMHVREYQWAMDTGEDVAGYARILGVVTLEDVVEELIKEEIEDEVDMGYSASMRPAEMIEAREEYRVDGMARARVVFCALLHRVRQRLRQRHRDARASMARAQQQWRDGQDQGSRSTAVACEEVVLSLSLLDDFAMSSSGSIELVPGAVSTLALRQATANFLSTEVTAVCVRPWSDDTGELQLTVRSSNPIDTENRRESEVVDEDTENFDTVQIDSMSDGVDGGVSGGGGSSSRTRFGRVRATSSSGNSNAQFVLKKGFASPPAIVPLLQKPLVLQPPKRVYSYATMQPILVVPPEDGRPVGGKKDGRNPRGSKATTHHHHSMKNSVKGHGMPRHRHPHGNTKDGESVIETHSPVREHDGNALAVDSDYFFDAEHNSRNEYNYSDPFAHSTAAPQPQPVTQAAPSASWFASLPAVATSLLAAVSSTHEPRLTTVHGTPPSLGPWDTPPMRSPRHCLGDGPPRERSSSPSRNGPAYGSGYASPIRGSTPLASFTTAEYDHIPYVDDAGTVFSTSPQSGWLGIRNVSKQRSSSPQQPQDTANLPLSHEEIYYS